MKLLFAALLIVSFSNVYADNFKLRVIGQYSIPTGTEFHGEQVGGLSGIDRAKDGSYYAITDHPLEITSSPHFYNVSLDYDVKGFHKVTINKQINIKNKQGSDYSRGILDCESIRTASNGHLYFSSEGMYLPIFGLGSNPSVQEMSINGDFIQKFNTPKMYNYVDNKTSGAQSNKVFESLTTTPNDLLYFVNEGSLWQDTKPNTSKKPINHLLRITAFNPKINTTLAQYIYVLPPIPIDNKPTMASARLAEMLAIDNHHFIGLESSYIPSIGNFTRLVEISISDNTTNVIKQASLLHAKFTPVTRKVLLELTPIYKGMKIDNLEGISWGKTLKNGHRTLVLVSDNNYNKSQTNQFLALEVIPNETANHRN